MTVCAVTDCARPSSTRGWCERHYTRYRRHGDPTIAKKSGPKPTPLVERLADKFLVGDGCWPWVGSHNEAGYGQIATGGNRKAQAHRAVYELLVGPIPEGLHLDHLCRNPNCVRPDHLEPVTQAENNRRAAAHCRTEDAGWSIEAVTSS